MTAPEPIRLGPEQRALVLKAFVGEAEKELKPLTATFSPRYELGTKLTFESPLDGACLGYVQRTRPKPQWQITDPDALTEHLAEKFSGVVDTVYLLEIPGAREPVALPEQHPITQALMQAAPELLTPERRVSPDAVQAALQETRDTGTPVAPGITLVRPGGNLNVVYDKTEAIPAILRLIAAGALDWHELVGGGAAALPAAPERQAS